MSRRTSWLALVSALMFSACDESRNPAGPAGGRPAAVISDGRFADGNDDFFFLPPMMADPTGTGNFDAGAFNAALGPSVNVCELTGSPATDPAVGCAPGTNGGQLLVADFPSDRVQVSTSDEFYSVNWHTDESDLKTERFYRLQVFLGAVRIGYADIDPVSSGRDLKNANTGAVIPLVDGRTLPVRFRIEHGVLCDNETDCGEYQVTNAGGTFVTNTGSAGIRFEEGFLPSGVSAITLTIERVVVGPDNRCHGQASALLWREYEGCYEITSDPDLRPYGGIQKPAVAGQCVEVDASDPLYAYLQPYKSHNGSELIRLESADAPFLDCEGFEGSPLQTGFRANRLSRLASAGIDRMGETLQRLFGVRSLHAIDLGLGEELGVGSALSRFGWAIGLEMESVAGSGQVTGFGMPASQPLQVRVRSLHSHQGDTGGDPDEDHSDAVEGVEVFFSISEGDGNFGFNPDQTPVLTRVDTTDAEGFATTTFTAASNSPINAIAARVPTVSGLPATFAVEGLPPDLQVTGLSRSIAEPTTGDALSWTFVVQNAGRGAAIPSVARLVVSLEEEGTETVGSFNVPVPRLLPGDTAVLETPVLAGPRTPGEHSVMVMVNATGLLIEGSEENNVRTHEFTVVDGRIDLAGAYGSLMGLGAFSRWNVFAGDIRADIGTSSTPWTDLANFNGFHVNNYDFELNRHLWADNYTAVERANVIIARAPLLDMSAQELERTIGEAKFIRAVAYYNLVTLYENVPLLTSPPSPQRVVETSTPEATWAQIEQDLVDAAAILPEIGAVSTATTRATRGAALAMLGRARLQMAGTLRLGAKWAEGAEALGAVISGGRYSLLANYADNFREVGDNGNPETVFDVRAEDSFASGQIGISFTKLIGPCSGSYHPTYCDARPTRAYFNAFLGSRTATGATDPRLDATILYGSEERGSEPIYGRTRASYFVDDPASPAREDTMIFFRKYGETELPSEQRWDNPVNFKVIRYADVLLMHAEALNETGQVAAASASLNRVRQRVGKAPVAGISQAQMRDTILAERMFELGLEGSRFNDLRRHGRLGSHLAEIDSEFGPNTQFGRPGFVVGKSERLPIPAFVMNTYPNVRQNPGW